MQKNCPNLKIQHPNQDYNLITASSVQLEHNAVRVCIQLKEKISLRDTQLDDYNTQWVALEGTAQPGRVFLLYMLFTPRGT